MSILRPPWLAMIFIAAGCCVFMCYPPWASGALLAVLLALAACQLVISAGRKGEEGRPPLAVWIAAGALLAWLGIVAARSECSELALRQVVWAVGFLAAAVLGAGVARQRRFVMYAALTAGVVLSAIGMAHWLGWNLMEHTTYENRLTAFTNPNRYAVLLTVCWACGTGALAGVWNSRWTENRRLRTGLLVAALVFVGACLALTLSRLTLMAASLTAALVSLAWMRLRQTDLRIPLETEGLARLVWQLLPAVTLIVALGACFAVGQHALRERAKDLIETDFDQRYRAWKAVWPLLWEHPLAGLGPGLFEARFTTVQPLDMQGRWRELHSDWLQLGVEAGMVTLVLALVLALAWLWDVWRRAKHSYRRDKARAFERLLPAAGIVVALLCSLADFPLREPATAVLVFFLAGMLCQQWPLSESAPAPLDNQGEAAAAPLRRRAVVWSGALALAAVFLAAAWIPGRNALAYARSPWLGHLFCPDPAADQADSWRAATAADPCDPELRFHAARAISRVGTPGALAEARAGLAAARRLNPYEHRYYWMAGIVEGWAGNNAAAAESARRRSAVRPTTSPCANGWAACTPRGFRGRPPARRATPPLQKRWATFNWRFRFPTGRRSSSSWNSAAALRPKSANCGRARAPRRGCTAPNSSCLHANCISWTGNSKANRRRNRRSTASITCCRAHWLSGAATSRRAWRNGTRPSRCCRRMPGSRRDRGWRAICRTWMAPSPRNWLRRLRNSSRGCPR